MFGNTFYSTGPRSGCRPHHHGGGRGFAQGPRGEFGGLGFGFGPGGGPRRRGRRARRGDIRTAALLLLAEEPRNGYQIMQEVQERSGGMWSPSPGSVYPALAQLEDEGLIRNEEHDGQKAFALTDAGRAFVQERDTERPAPWEQQDVGGEFHALAALMREVAGAFVQVMKNGSPGQIEKAQGVLADTRRALYRILADGDIGAPETSKDADAAGDADTVDEDS
jgi:DNA-binding PadR family transcriptional regulator